MPRKDDPDLTAFLTDRLHFGTDRDLYTAREVWHSYRHVDVKGKRVLDVGANCGYYSALALRAGAARVWAVEPLPRNVELLRANVQRHGTRARVFAAAAMPPGSPDKIGLYSGAQAGKSVNFGHNTVRAVYDTANPAIVEVKTVDFQALLDKLEPHVLKIDCEGSEHAVLLHAKMPATLKNILGEVHFFKKEFRTLWPQVKANMAKQGFKIVAGRDSIVNGTGQYGYLEWERK